MRIERYYASIKDDVSPLTTDALALLNSQDYIGFFKACGPAYVRSIRRAQEVVAFLTFTSTSSENASSYASSFSVGGWWGRYSRSNSNSSRHGQESRSLKITILGYGLGLTQDGSETLIATTVQELYGVMRFAFRTMTTSEDSIHIGMVYGMEVAPWVESVQFQVTIGIGEEDITTELPYSLVPKSYRISDPSDKIFDNDDRDSFTCKHPSFEKDQFGMCCAVDQLYNYDEEEYDITNPRERVCRPLRQLERTLVKDNLIQNGEFVARLDAAVRYRMTQLSTIERCISAVRAIPDRYDHYALKTQDSVLTEGADDPLYSVYEMKMAMDPFNDFGMVNQVAKELDEFLDMYYQPCLAALFGANIGTSPDTDPKFFMAEPWYAHDECSVLSCLGNTMRWSREDTGGCVPGILNGPGSTPYDWNDSTCSKTIDLNGNEVCKHDSEMLWNYQFKADVCWRHTVGGATTMFYLNNFCMPSITDNVVDIEYIDTMKSNAVDYCGDANPESNVPSGAPTEIPSVHASARPSDVPSIVLSEVPSLSFSNSPSDTPSQVPSDTPSLVPSQVPSDVPSAEPTDKPSQVPSVSPTDRPSDTPSQVPSDVPSAEPTDKPTQEPSMKPSEVPSQLPSEVPSDVPSDVPSFSSVPSQVPSEVPSLSSIPSQVPSDVPSDVPSAEPTDKPSQVPSAAPTDRPSDVPSEVPSDVPSLKPSQVPSGLPSEVPSQEPSQEPSEVPSEKPSEVPSEVPSDVPSLSSVPSKEPTN